MRWFVARQVSRAYAFIIAFGIDYKQLAVCFLLQGQPADNILA
jgi:hypothetical protein